MTNIDLGKYKITQLGYVYRDIEEQAHILETQLGIPKFAYFENKFKGTYKYRGKDTKFWSRIGISKGLGLQIELVQLIEGECIFSEFIDAGKEGLHHYGLFVDDLETIREMALSKELEIIHEGTTGVVNVLYVDTFNLLGAFLEFQESITKKRK